MQLNTHATAWAHLRVEKIGDRTVPATNARKWAVRAGLESVRAVRRFWSQFEPDFPFFFYFLAFFPPTHARPRAQRLRVVTAWPAATWLTFLSVSPSLDFIGVGADVDTGVDVGAGADVDAGAGAGGTGPVCQLETALTKTKPFFFLKLYKEIRRKTTPNFLNYKEIRRKIASAFSKIKEIRLQNRLRLS